MSTIARSNCNRTCLRPYFMLTAALVIGQSFALPEASGASTDYVIRGKLDEQYFRPNSALMGERTCSFAVTNAARFTTIGCDFGKTSYLLFIDKDRCIQLQMGLPARDI